MTSHDEAALALLREVSGGPVTIVAERQAMHRPYTLFGHDDLAWMGAPRDPNPHEVYDRQERDARAALFAGACVCSAMLVFCLAFWALVAVAVW